ncbi:MAG TPA: GIY-YIG nuclease family protein [Verrucomicrobiota bacterium]|nr:GIY-YIG nuclease family protein [Verrucomicrobiota bacterium]
MPERINDEDLELLSELGVEAEPEVVGGRSAREQRIIAGYEEIVRFVVENGRLPQHGENRDIFERIYAVRLDRLRESGECRAVLSDLDKRGLLGDAPETSVDQLKDEPTDAALLSMLGVEADAEEDVTNLVHVRSRDEIKAAEEIAQRNPCKDFEKFRPTFEKVQLELASGQRKTLKFEDYAEVKKGDLFVLDGQKVIVAEMGESFVSDYGRPDRRLRVIYDNGTESDLLLRSLQRALNKDKASRRITEPNLGPLFSEVEEPDDFPTGYIYVLRSKSDHPFVAQNRSVIHKIGLTGGDVKARVANAKKEPTYLFAEVEIVATFKLANINRKRLEALLHKFFAKARLDLKLPDRFGLQVESREWFLVPFPVIEEAIQKLMDGTIENFRYDPETARIVGI